MWSVDTRVYYWHAQTVQNSTRLQITISLFYLAAKHPEEGSNAETSVYLYRHLASFEQ